MHTVWPRCNGSIAASMYKIHATAVSLIYTLFRLFQIWFTGSQNCWISVSFTIIWNTALTSWPFGEVILIDVNNFIFEALKMKQSAKYIGHILIMHMYHFVYYYYMVYRCSIWPNGRNIHSIKNCECNRSLVTSGYSIRKEGDWLMVTFST